MLVRKHKEFSIIFRPFSIAKTLKLFSLLIMCSAVFFGGTLIDAKAAQVTLAWDASTHSDVDKYNLYYQECSIEEKCTTSDSDKDSLGVWTINISDLDNPSDPSYTLHNLSDNHKYAFVLTACSRSGEESGFSNEVSFTSSGTSDDTNPADNQPPKVDAGKDQTVEFMSGAAILSGLATDDGLPADSDLTFQWSQSSGPSQASILGPTDATTSVSFSLPGTYTFELTATDGQLSASDSVTIKVHQSDSNDDDSDSDDQTDDSSDDSGDDVPIDEVIIIDNSDLNNTDSQGTWKKSVGPKPHADNSVYGRKGSTFSWFFVSSSTGVYDMSIYWTYHKTRSTSVPISIESEKGIEIINLNQKDKSKAAKWISLGQFGFIAGESYEIKITAPNQGYKTTSADAVKFEYLGADDYSGGDMDDTAMIIDNSDQQNILYTGSWRQSVGKNPYGDNSVYGRNGATFTWTFTGPDTGMQNVSIWWTFHSTRGTAIPLSITSEDGVMEMNINQQQNASTWFSLGEYSFVAGKNYEITMSAPQGSKTACADAIRITTVP